MRYYYLVGEYYYLATMVDAGRWSMAVDGHVFNVHVVVLSHTLTYYGYGRTDIMTSLSEA